MSEANGFPTDEQLLIMAAAIHGFCSQTDLERANGDKIVGQALEWLGILKDRVRESWENYEYCEEIVAVYGTLIRVTHQLHKVGAGRPPASGETPIFEGSGNHGTPAEPGAFPHFNSFRLTPHGEQLAAELLKQHPEFQSSELRSSHGDRPGLRAGSTRGIAPEGTETGTRLE